LTELSFESEDVDGFTTGGASEIDGSAGEEYFGALVEIGSVRRG
jgi:hypothetical protein